MPSSRADAGVTLSREDARRLTDVLTACVSLVRTVVDSGPHDDRVIDVVAASILYSAEDWVQYLRDEMRQEP